MVLSLQQQINETFSVSQTPSVFSCRVENIEEELRNWKESISENRIIDINIPYLVVFLVRFYTLCECSPLAFYERFEKNINKTIIVIFKMLHQQLQIYL